MKGEEGVGVASEEREAQVAAAMGVMAAAMVVEVAVGAVGGVTLGTAKWELKRATSQFGYSLLL